MESLNHIAIIMDGNGRWASERGMPRAKGHQEGVKVSKKIIEYCTDIKLPFVTLYVFSTENMKREQKEVRSLMELLKKHLTSDLPLYREKNIRVLHIGDLEGLSIGVQKKIIEVQEKTKTHTGTTVVLAINYGGKDEIVRAIKKIPLEEVKNIDDERFSSFLDTQNIPPVDLLIRTGGEWRISNFLLWQASYAELYFSDKYWPDWGWVDMQKAIDEYYKRNRRFGREK